MAGAEALDYSQVIWEAEGALNKFLLIFQSISTKGRMGERHFSGLHPPCQVFHRLGRLHWAAGASHSCTLGVQQALCTCAWPRGPVQLQQLCKHTLDLPRLSRLLGHRECVWSAGLQGKHTHGKAGRALGHTEASRSCWF